MIVITTPTGDIGRQVLDQILDSDEAVRVIARDPARLPERVHARAEVVHGSHGDADVIAKALVGADRLFWLVPPPAFGSAVGATQYYLDFTRPAAEAAASRGVGMVGVTSLGHGYRKEAGLLSAALAMDALIESTGAGYRALALPFFMENLLRHAESITEQGTFSMANAADRPLPAVATRDAAAAATALLLDRTWSGQARVPVVSPDNLTPDEMARVISETLGRPVSYRQVPVADFGATMRRYGASEAMAQGMTGMLEAQNNGIYDVEQHVTHSAGATSFRQWCLDIFQPAVQA
ncbi:NAD(P)H-binding protein [Actinoplanes sp. NPDC023936]|uniref:NmrA family NAD(P)-binding protein n=1 Tax=Actinoplanes sp. NPDC023936 TaxID=3154910 RepID=UPI0033F8E175